MVSLIVFTGLTVIFAGLVVRRLLVIGGVGLPVMRNRPLYVLGLLGGFIVLGILLVYIGVGWSRGPLAADAWGRTYRWTYVPLITALFVFLATEGGDSRTNRVAQDWYAAMGEAMRAQPAHASAGFIAGFILFLPFLLQPLVSRTAFDVLTLSWLAFMLVELVLALWWLATHRGQPRMAGGRPVRWPWLASSAFWGWVWGGVAGLLIYSTLALASLVP